MTHPKVPLLLTLELGIPNLEDLSNELTLKFEVQWSLRCKMSQTVSVYML